MTNSDEARLPLRGQVEKIDVDIPLKMPFMADMTTLWPRIERMEAKIASSVDYIEYLEGRIAELEKSAG